MDLNLRRLLRVRTVVYFGVNQGERNFCHACGLAIARAGEMTSSMREPRRVLADCSPRTHEIASAMFDLPQPFGPMMAATPSP